MKKGRNLETFAIVVISITMIIATICTVWMLNVNPDVYPKATTTIVQEAGRSDSKKINSMSGSVLLVDRSGSTEGTTIAGANYETVLDFSSGIGVRGGYSEIAEAIQEKLEEGYRIIGVITDMQQYHSDGNQKWSALKGKFSNTEVKIYLTESYDDSEVLIGMKAIESVLDKNTCTLAVYDSYGNLQNQFGGFDNFSYQDLNSVYEKPNIVLEETTINTGNSIPYSAHTIERLFWFFVFEILTIIIVLLLKKPNSDTPEPIKRAIAKADAILLDGSASVKKDYNEMVKYCENSGVTEVIRFAKSVDKMTIDEAAITPAEGKTDGYSAMKLAFDDGCKTIIIVSDGDFTSSEDIASGVHFDKIIFVGKKMNIEHLRKFATEVEVIKL